jgi:hypothetical protein
MTWLKRNLTDTRLLIIGLTGSVIFAVITALLTLQPSGSYTSVRDDRAGGAKALKLWLEDIGYEVKELGSLESTEEVDVLFVLSPRNAYSESEARYLAEWVRRGNHLIVAGNIFTLNSVLEPYQMGVQYHNYDLGRRSLNSPALSNPPFEQLRVGQVYRIVSDRPDLVMHLNDGDVPIIASVAERQGEVWVSGTIRPFTNLGLGDDASAGLILNILSNVPRSAVIGFDEGLHGEEAPPETLTSWLRETPAGWSILSSIGLVMVFLFMHGRRFGQAFPIREEQLRREPVEYIQAMANLFRRSGQREATMAHYRQMLRRHLAKRYSVDPHLEDTEFVKTIAARDITVSEGDLLRLLKHLSKSKVGEQELLYLAVEVDEWIKKLS